MPTNSRGTYLPLHTPPDRYLPDEARAALHPYYVAVSRLREATTALDTLTTVAAAAEAEKLDRESFKDTGKSTHKHADRLETGITNAKQAVAGLTELALDAEITLIQAMYGIEGPDPEVQVQRARQAFDDLLDAYAQERALVAVRRWMQDPSRPYAPGSTSQVEQDILRQRSYFRPADNAADGLTPGKGEHGFGPYDGPTEAYREDNPEVLAPLRSAAEPPNPYGVNPDTTDFSMVGA